MDEWPGVQDVFAKGSERKVPDVRPGEMWVMRLVALPGGTEEKQNDRGRRKTRK